MANKINSDVSGNNLFRVLRKLFSTDVIIRNVGGKQLKVADVDHLQSTGNLKNNRIADKYNRLWHSPVGSVGNQIQAYQVYRRELFQDYESMEAHSLIATVLDIYADEVCLKNEFGDILTIQSSDDKIQRILHNLFYDIINIEFNLWPWVRNMVKYGDHFLKLEITEKFGITNVIPFSAYQLLREEGTDPKNPNYVKFRFDESSGMRTYMTNYGTTSKDGIFFENYEIAHFRLLSDTNFLPYGKSMLEGARKVWKQLILLEDAWMVHLMMRAPDKRIFKIDIGNIPPTEVDAYMQKIINQMKKIPYMDQNTGQYNLKYNMQNQLEDFYLPVRGGESGTSIENLTGLQIDFAPALDYLKGLMYAALKVPKAFLGDSADTSGKSTLALMDLRFARTIERLQNMILSELTKIAIIHLAAQGYDGEDLVNFDLKLTNSSIIYDKERIELWQAKVNLAKDMTEAKLASKKWQYVNIFNMTDKDYDDQKQLMVFDAKDNFRIKQIEEEGNDPSKTGRSFGTPHDIATLYKGNAGVPAGYNEKEEDNRSNSGRPEINGTTGTHDGLGGWDPMGIKNAKAKSGWKPTLESLGIGNKFKHLILENTDTNTEKEPAIDAISFLDESNIIEDTNNL